MGEGNGRGEKGKKCGEEEEGWGEGGVGEEGWGRRVGGGELWEKGCRRREGETREGEE